MTRFYLFFVSCLLTAFSVDAQMVVMDSAAMQSDYSQEVYYKLGPNTKTSVSTDWDIALSTQPSNPPFDTEPSVAIRINAGHGVRLYRVTNADTAGYAALLLADSSSWKPLFDDAANWDKGAFNAFSYMTATAYDYGWGTYSTASHNVVADSLYAIRTVSGSWKKLWIKKLVFDTVWHVSVSDFENMNPSQLTVSKQSAVGKNFVYVNLDNGSVEDKEPAGWDLLFTRYVDLVPDPFTPGSTAHYPVNGVLINKGVMAVKAHPVDDVANANFMGFNGLLSSAANAIGYDWKTLVAGAYEVEDSLVYFVQARDNNVYKIQFTAFKTNNRETVFAISTTGFTKAPNVDVVPETVLYPNPANDRLVAISFDVSGNQTYRVADATGKIVAAGLLKNGQNAIDVSNFAAGVYVFQTVKDQSVQTQKFVVNR